MSIYSSFFPFYYRYGIKTGVHNFILSVRRNASAGPVSVCVCVCLSQVGVLSKRLHWRLLSTIVL